MKILLSAYACEPNKGSEPGVGWSWATELAKTNDVWVLTRDNNEPTISEYLRQNPSYENEHLHFIYVGLSKKWTFWKKGRRGMRLFYMLWQRKAAKIAKQWNEKIHFDLAHHVTFVSFTQVTYLYKLGMPMIWGPVAGGENIPANVKIQLSAKERIAEIVRKISQSAALGFGSIRKTMKAAQYILVTTEETKAKIPSQYVDKTFVLPAIGLEKMPEIHGDRHCDEKIRIVMAGRLIYWKAFDIGIKAFLKIADQHPNAELHILGEGNCKESLQHLAGAYLNKQVFFDAPVQHDQIYDYYQNFDLFVNTSLRDSGCMTMMEAMSVGLPSIAIATGGPGVLLEPFEECKIEPRSYEYCVNQIAEKLENLMADGDARVRLGQMQREYAKNTFTISHKVAWIRQLEK